MHCMQRLAAEQITLLMAVSSKPGKYAKMLAQRSLTCGSRKAREVRVNLNSGMQSICTQNSAQDHPWNNVGNTAQHSS